MRWASSVKRVLGKSRVGRVTSRRSPLECLMTPKTFAEQMRQARSKSPLLKRGQALKQFAEVEAFLARPSKATLKPKDCLPPALEGIVFSHEHLGTD